MEIFLHLPKTAGSTLLSILERQYGPNCVLKLYSSTFGEEILDMGEEQIERIRILVGHFYYGIHSFLPKPASYFTVLRNPVGRVISHYYYVKRSPEHYLFQEANRLSLPEFVQYCGRAEPNNDQTRLLAGKDYLPDSGECTPEMLPIAKQNLGDHFRVIGLTEEFDKSLLLMKSVFGWKMPFYTKQNVGQQGLHKEAISDETLHTIQALNEMDLDLYEYGKALFQRQVSSLGSDFERELRWFRLTNYAYRKIFRLRPS